jgi:hypothetical protein
MAVVSLPWLFCLLGPCPRLRFPMVGLRSNDPPPHALVVHALCGAGHGWPELMEARCVRHTSCHQYTMISGVAHSTGLDTGLESRRRPRHGKKLDLAHACSNLTLTPSYQI